MLQLRPVLSVWKGNCVLKDFSQQSFLNNNSEDAIYEFKPGDHAVQHNDRLDFYRNNVDTIASI